MHNKLPQQQVGINAVLDQALQAYEKLPMLQVIFDKLVRSLSIALRHFTSENVEIDITGFNSSRLMNFAKSMQGPNAIAVFKAVEWEGFGLVIFDNHLVTTMIDILLGGKKMDTPLYTINRLYTPIEQGIIKQVTKLVLNELSTAFAQISQVNFNLERLETNINVTNIARPSDAVILLQLDITINGRNSSATLLIPYATIEPVKDKLQQVFVGDKFTPDNGWSEELLASIYNIEMPIAAVINDHSKSLQEVINLQIGSTLVLDYKENEHIDITCEDLVLFKGYLGKIHDKVAVNITQVCQKS